MNLEPPLPEVVNGDFYIVLLEELGYTQTYGMGEVPLSWSDLKSWRDCIGLEIDYSDIKLLKKLSEAYAIELSNATNKNRPAPYVPVVEVVDSPQDVSNKLKDAFRSMKGIRKRI